MKFLKNIYKFIKKNIGIEDIIIASLFIYLIYSLKEKKVENMTDDDLSKHSLLKDGKKIRFKTSHTDKYLRGFGDGKIGLGGAGKEEMWIVKDARNNQFAFYNPSHKRFLRAHADGHMDLSEEKNDYNDIQSLDYKNLCLFHVYKAGDDKIGLLTYHKGWVAITDEGKSMSKSQQDKDIATWMNLERFTITNAEEDQEEQVQEDQGTGGGIPPAQEEQGPINIEKIDEVYRDNIVKKMGYMLENLFSPQDIAMIEENTFFDEDDNVINNLVNLGLTSDYNGNTKTTIYTKINNNVYHAFSKIYSKLICCVGEETEENGKKTKSLELSIPIYNPETGLVEINSRNFSIKDAEANCSLPDGNFYDDGSKENGSIDCDHLMRKYCLFLQKYDPNNKLITKLCGCVLIKKHIPDVFLKEQNYEALAAVQAAPNCAFTECNNAIWKPTNMRNECTTQITICENKLVMKDIQAGGNVDIGEITMDNNCKNELTTDESIVNSQDIPKNNIDTPVEEEQNYTAPPPSLTRDEILEILKNSQDLKSQDSQDSQESQEETGFFGKIWNFYTSLFSSDETIEGFSKNNNNFKKFYSIFSIIIIYTLILKDPLKIKKKLN